MAINVCIFSGNLGNDCKVTSTPNGKYIASFSLPVKQGYGEHKIYRGLLVKCLVNVQKVNYLAI